MMSTARRVGDVIRLERRIVDVDPLATYEEIGIRSFGNGIFHKEPVSGTDLGTKRIFQVQPGDLVLSNVFAWEGAIALAAPAEAGRVGSHRFMTYVPVGEDVDSGYLRWFFLSDPGLALIRQASPGSAGRNRTLAVDRFEDLLIPLPPLSDQRRIAQHLERITVRLSRIDILSRREEQLAAALSASMLRTNAPHRRLGDLLDHVRREEVVQPDAEYGLLGVRWYGEGLFLREKKSGSDVAAAKLYRVEHGDFVYNRLFAWKGSFAVAGESDHGCYVSGEFPTFEVNSTELNGQYLWALFSQPDLWLLIEDRSAGGTPTSRNRLNEGAFLNLGIPLPPLKDQAFLAALVDRVRTTGHLRLRRTRYLEALRMSALNHAFAWVTT